LNIINAVKKKVLLSLLASPALVAAPFFASSPFSKAQETTAATSYIDVASSLSSLSSGSFYLFGAYNEENGVPYVYLMSYRYTGTFVRVPCLSKTDVSHPCGISESDFTSSCLYSIIRAQTLSTTVSDLTFGFIANVGALYADKTSHEFTGTTTTDGNVTPTLTFDTTASPNTLSLGGWEYQIANGSATFKGYGSTVDNSYSTALYVYPVTSNLLSATAVGFAQAVSNGQYTAETAESAFQSLDYTQRNLFAYYMNTYRTSSVATQAVEKILINGVSVYQTLMGTTTGIFHSKTPTLAVDYAQDAITGLVESETYTLSINGVNTCRVTYVDGALPFAGIMDNTLYDCAGQTVALNVYWPSGDGGGDTSSSSAEVSITARLSAPSTSVSLARVAVTPSETTTELYDDSITLIPESGIQYAISSSSTLSGSDVYSLTWSDTPSFTGLSPETSYTLYKRVHSLTECDSLPKYDETSGTYLGQSFTTLSEIEGAKKKALIANEKAYEQELAKLGTSANGANLLAMLLTYKSKIEGAASLTDLTTLAADTYRQDAFAFALVQDQTIVSLASSVSLVSSDSSASSALYQETLEAIQALDFFKGDNIAKADALAKEAEWKIAAFRYRESAGKSLVDFFNDSILAKTGLLSESQVESLWTSFTTLFHNVMSTLSSDLATTKTAVDSAFDTAKTSLTSQLKGMGA